MTTLPPKTCSIERLITKPADIALAISGEKKTSRRNGRYADIGEIWQLDGQTFRITNVYQQKIADMTAQDFMSEGFADKAAYFAYIDSVHKGMPIEVLSNGSVWVHEFERTAE